MAIRKDLMGVEPKIGDSIAYNPPYYKGVEVGTVIGFSPTGIPIIVKRSYKEYFDLEVSGGHLPPSKYHTSRYVHIPRTGFVVINKQEENGENIQTT